MLNKLLLALSLFTAAASAQTVISVLQGNAQLVPANLGQPSKPIVFQVTVNGVPAAGVHITITNSLGLVFSPLSSTSLVTDSNGQAFTQFLPGTLTTSSDFSTYFFTATTNLGASTNFLETAYYVSPTLQQGAGVYRLAPDPSLLNPLTGTAGIPTVPFTVQVLATAGSQSGQPIPNVGLHVVLNQNPSAGSPVQTAYCAEGQGAERLVLTNSSGVATCTPVFTLPSAALNPAVEGPAFTMSVGDFNNFGPFAYNIAAAPLVLSNPGTRLILANQSFSLALSANGGAPPYSFSLAPGSNPLPPGLALSSSGVISGIPSVPKLYSFTIQVTDKLGTVATNSATLAVSGGPMQILVPPTPAVLAGTSFDLTLRVSGGVPPYTLSPLTALPAGVTLIKSDDVGDTSELKGSIPTPGSYPISLVAVDAVGNVSTPASFNLAVVTPLTFAPVTLPFGILGKPFSATLQASGGQAPYTFTLASGSSPLPAGLSLSSTGVLAGIPTTAGVYHFTVQASDPLRNTAAAGVTLAISGGPLTLDVPSALPAAVAGSPYSATLLAKGGVGPYTFKFEGTPPAGLTLSPDGVLTGTLSLAGTRTFSVDVSDSLGNVASAQLQLAVVTPPPAVVTIANGASFLTGSLAPGEIVSLFGTNLGPATPATLVVDPTTGKVGTSLAGVQVFIDGIAAPLLYVSSTQVNLVVPYGVTHPDTTLAAVYLGQPSVAVPVTIRPAAPGIFTLGGAQQAAVLNADGTVNGPDNPAARGSEVAIFATGAGQTTPPVTDGQIPTAGSTANIADLTATVGGLPATVLYAGVAPGLVAGVVQINVQIPAGAPVSAADTIVFSVGTSSSQTSATIAVK